MSITIDPEKFVSRGDGYGRMTLDCYRPLRRKLGYTIGIYHKDSFFHLPPTPSLTRFLGPEIGFNWHGPFLAHGYNEPKIEEELDQGEDEIDLDAMSRPRDLDTSALAPLLDFFWFRGTVPLME